MPAISTCPKCQKAVAIPSGVDSAAAVRCPLCSAEYPLSDVLPPELIPVEMATASEPIEVAEKNEALVVVDRTPLTGVVARRRPSRSALRTLIEVVGGGLAGCVVAYYVLALCMGANFKKLDLPPIPLPGIAWLTTPADPIDAAGEKPAYKAYNR
jgi:hypothetical protein